MALVPPHSGRVFLYSYSDAGARVVCPLIERNFNGHADVATPAGFSGFAGTGHSPGFPAQWRMFSRRQHWVCGYIGLHPLLNYADFVDPQDLQFDRTVYVLQVDQGDAELLGQFSTNRKRQIRSWQLSGRQMTRDPAAITAFLAREAPGFYRARHASSSYAIAPEGWSMLLAQPDVIAFGALDEGQITAASVFAVTGWLAEYLFNISVPAGQWASAPLLWEGALAVRERKASVLNLGGGIREGDSLAEFKRRFGSKSLLQPCLKQIYDPERYAQLCEKASVGTDHVVKFFPPYYG
jgi:hypothetical protein